MFIQLFRDTGSKRREDPIETLDQDALRARIGEWVTRERPRQKTIQRSDGPRPSTRAPERGVAGLPR